MKNPTFPFLPLTSFKPASFKKAIAAIAHYLTEQLFHLLVGSSEPIISEHSDEDGEHYYRVYDPIYEKNLYFASEEDVRIWLEKRYNRHSIEVTQ